MGMGLFMAVGRGSDNPPRMIVMRSGKAGEKDALGRHLAIVGKGVCFDSGGISIKPSDRMEEMKMDKTGACTVIAAAVTVARLAPGTPLLDRRPGGREHARPALDPPRRHRQGAQRQVGRHHQHGRRGPADPRRRADLRGAARRHPPRRRGDAHRRRGSRALGDLVSGAFGTPQAFVDEVFAAGARAGERYWQLPLDRRVPRRTWRAGTATS